MRYTTKLLPSRVGNLAILTLNNPGSFHALTTDMIYCLQDVLKEWYQDPTLQAILLKSSNTRNNKRPAFCAGGDVKSVYLSGTAMSGASVPEGQAAGGLQPPPSSTSTSTTLPKHGVGYPGLETSDFFRHEYDVNHQMAVNKDVLPQVSLWDGMVMGGGVGISIHGKYRVATEHAVFSMPETAIGLFPDVGSCWWMPRLLPPGMAVYLALTGQRLYPPDLLYAGLATHYVPSARLPDLEVALAQADKTEIADVLLSFHENTAPDPLNSALAQDRGVIDQVFDHVFDDDNSNNGNNDGGGGARATVVTVESIVDTLEKLDTEFARSTLKTLRSMSPTSLKVTLEGLRRGYRLKSIEDDFRMEFRMVQGFMRGRDFFEGVRARLIDKDNQPRWDPSRLEDVTDAVVASYFEPLPYEWSPLSAAPSDPCKL
jgi:enoyl-CoA hydratase/carnithine racemase